MSLEEWEEHTYNKGTSGDVVGDILSDWRKRETELLSRLSKAEAMVEKLLGYGNDTVSQ